jgi:protein O-mannosyl-transferase
MRARLLTALVIALAVMAVNWPTLHHPLVHDDLHSIVLNPAARQAEFSWRFFTHPETFSSEASMYRPLLMLSYVLNLRLGGLDPIGFHLLNLLLHLLACGMVYWLARILPPLKSWAFWIALLFALHPVHSEVLNYVSCRSDLGAAAFGLLSVAASLKLAASERPRPAFALVSLLAFTVALGFKDLAVIVPAQILFLDFLCFRQARIQNYLTNRSRSFTIFAATWVGLILIAFGYLALRRGLALETFLIAQPARPVWINLLTQTRGLCTYLRLLFWPSHLSLEHQVPVIEPIADPAFLAAALLLLALLVIALVRLRRNPVIALAFGWFILCLLPTSSLIPLNVISSENRLYQAGLASAWLLAALAQAAAGTSRKRTTQGLLLVVAFCFGALTLLRHPAWDSSLTLFRDLVRKAPGIARGHVNYGVELRNAHRPQDAAAQYLWALDLEPQNTRALSNLATAYHDLGRPEQELKVLRRTLDLDPGDVVAWRNYGYLLAEQGRPEEALAAVREAVRLAPRRPDLHYDLGVLCLSLGLMEEGKRELEESLRLNPDQPQVKAALDMIRQGRR